MPAEPPAEATQQANTFLDRIQATLTDIGKGFSTEVGKALTVQMKQVTAEFREAHPAIAQVSDQVAGFAGTLSLGTTALAQLTGSTLESAKNISELVTMMRPAAAAQGTLSTATNATATAQRGLNVAMRANLIGLVVTGITLLVSAFIAAYQRSTTFRNIVNAVFTAVRNVVVNAVNVIRAVVAVVWPVIVRIIQTAVTVIRAYVTTYFTIIRTVITVIFNAVRAYIGLVWNAIRTIITAAVTVVVGTIGRIRQVIEIVRGAFETARSAVSDRIGAIVDLVRGLPGRAVAVLTNIGITLYNLGRDLIQGFINGIRDMAGRIVDTIQNFVIDKIPGPIKDALGISSPSRLMVEIGHDIGAGLTAGIDQSQDSVADAMRRLVPVPGAGVRGSAREVTVTALSGGLASAVAAVTASMPPTAPVTVNVFPQAGQSEYEIGRIAARELAWAVKR